MRGIFNDRDVLAATRIATDIARLSTNMDRRMIAFT